MSPIRKVSSEAIFYYTALVGLTYIKNCTATPSHLNPPLKDPWSRETKIAFLSQQNYNSVSSGYSLAMNINNSKINLGFLGKTDPFEPLNKLAFSRFYFRYKQKNATWIIGSYRIQLGEGIIKSLGTPSYLSNPSWANKSEEWNVKENRGFSRYFPILGIAGKTNLSNRYQIIYSLGKANLSGKMEDDCITSWNKTGLLSDSIKLSQKHNFHCITATNAIRFQTKLIAVGLGMHSHVFSIPVQFHKRAKPYEVEWFDNYLRNTNTSNSTNTNYLYKSNNIQQLHATEFWVTQSCKNGNLLFINAINQFEINPKNLKQNPIKYLPSNIYDSQSKRIINNVKNRIALTTGVLIPLNKLNDIGIKYQYVGNEFESLENLEIQQIKGVNSLQIAIKKQPSQQLHLSMVYLLQKKSSSNQLSTQPLENIMRCKIQYQQSNVLMKLGFKLSRRESLMSNENTQIEFTAQEEVEHSINPSDLNQIDVFWQQLKPSTIFQMHNEIQVNQNQTTSSEFHTYLQSINNQSSGCLEFIIKNQWHNTVQNQAGIAIFNTSSPLVIQGLQLGTTNSFQFVNKQGIFFFFGILHKPSRELTQLLQLQIMQNFNPQRPISVRIFAVIWLR